VDATILAGLMGLVGAIIGGIGSYLGGIRGAKQSYDLDDQRQKRQSHRQLMMQLRYSYDLIYNNSQNLTIAVDTFIYDDNWSSHLADTGLSQEEKYLIIKWFQELKRFNMYAATAPYREKEIKTEDCRALLDSHGYRETIKSIIDKYNS
jgi:hypothetical protein